MNKVITHKDGMVLQGYKYLLITKPEYLKHVTRKEYEENDK